MPVGHGEVSAGGAAHSERHGIPPHQFPNAAKEYLRFMLEADQYEPWLNACLGYWGHQLKAYDQAAVWSGDPKVRIFRNSGDREFWTGYKGPISAASGARRGQLCHGAHVRLRRVRPDKPRGRGAGSRAAGQAVLQDLS